MKRRSTLSTLPACRLFGAATLHALQEPRSGVRPDSADDRQTAGLVPSPNLTYPTLPYRLRSARLLSSQLACSHSAALSARPLVSPAAAVSACCCRHGPWLTRRRRRLQFHTFTSARKRMSCVVPNFDANGLPAPLACCPTGLPTAFL